MRFWNEVFFQSHRLIVPELEKNRQDCVLFLGALLCDIYNCGMPCTSNPPLKVRWQTQPIVILISSNSVYNFWSIRDEGDLLVLYSAVSLFFGMDIGYNTFMGYYTNSWLLSQKEKKSRWNVILFSKNYLRSFLNFSFSNQRYIIVYMVPVGVDGGKRGGERRGEEGRGGGGYYNS